MACDVGLDITVNMTLRLYGLDCPELPTEEGVAARDYVTGWLADHPGPLALRTVKDKREKYGRYLADLVAADGASLCADLLASGNAVVYLP